MRWGAVPTPMGEVGVAVDEHGVRAVRFDGPGGPVDAAPDGVLLAAVEQLAAYFAGELVEFDLPLVVVRGTGFERAVWDQIARIPYAEMLTYGAVAAAVGGEADGDPLAARAVGVACNRNPLPIVVPCHRVVGAGGRLVGFGGGLPRKRFLLELEAKVRIARDFAL